MLRVITMTSYRQPDDTREVLAALAKCDGIADWLLLPNVEPGNDAVIEAFRARDACEMRLVVNEKRLGLKRNAHKAVFRAFKLRADVTLHLEDDTVPSPDTLQHFDWAVRSRTSNRRKAVRSCWRPAIISRDVNRRPIVPTIAKPARSGRRGAGPSTASA